MSSPARPEQDAVRPSHRLPRGVRPNSAQAAVSLLVVAVVAALLLWGVSRGIARNLPDPSPWPPRLEVAQPRVVVLKSRRRLHLFDGERLVRSYAIALGQHPTGQKIQAGDQRTPEGVFRICTKNPDSRYHRFLGISYPDIAAAQRGLRDGRISLGEFQSIVAADRNGQCPPWTTALGGGIGLHGHGIASDWTAGCVALSDADAEELYDVLRPGDLVEILP